MENYQGDLTDIFSGALLASPAGNFSDTWQYPPTINDETGCMGYCYPPLDRRDFGDPFCSMPAGSPPAIFPEQLTGVKGCFELDLVDAAAGDGGGVHRTVAPTSLPELVLDDDGKRKAGAPACSVFSRKLRISPYSNHTPPPPTAASTVVFGAGNYEMKIPESRAADYTSDAVLQISLPRNTGVMKRRKSLAAKKVVCVPAPEPANSRQSGEVVPSDLWAWRKYGQKPIKGSPYPRGYYRCSSSKGCSARKQVERSRTDPNTLVITYSSEHNHPWPTQKNALTGSTRFQPSKPELFSIGKQHNSTIQLLDEGPGKSAGDSHNRGQMSDFGLPADDHSSEDFFADLDEIEATTHSIPPFGFNDWSTTVYDNIIIHESQT
ncbi:unnamed protein product [Cuscuta epithymum]|uniref:WRKY domain-containing protein n=1 Tax=Cuscuta epithymum TaxID=186058 RepID=A0AAV0G0R0_9ASTE|nr:unnamed protein product [Cuscuta epithymum]CAH9141217.1 unnamed protein product [Cuscuta epithymum]